MLDCTVGGGGHAEALLEAGVGSALYVGLDRDPAALEAAGARLARFGARVRLVHRAFSGAREVLAELGVSGVDGLLADLGVSSPQLDHAGRGFGFRAAGPLDMRMDPSGGRTALELLQTTELGELAAILREQGEVPGAERMARVLHAAAVAGTANSTVEFAALIERNAHPALRKRKVHPATLVFQALRCAVNDEPGELDALLTALPALVAPGGRAAIVSFHSLEDRAVKHAFRSLCGEEPDTHPILRSSRAPDFCPVHRRAVEASEAELSRNPRARSARLRAIERTPLGAVPRSGPKP
jgi:16S rRNA (cytosine1402-N4)-methyltransferase